MQDFPSPLGGFEMNSLSVTERVFANIAMDGPAVIDGPTGAVTTGAALRDRIERLAGGLNAAGRGAGETSAILAPNSADYVTAFHAVAWAGGTISTINPAYTAAEVRHQLKDCEARTLFTTSAFLETAQAGAGETGVDEIIVLDGDGLTPWLGAPQRDQHPVDVRTHVVALPYSSGTTGLPKGVMLTHSNLSNNIDQAAGLVHVEKGERFIAFLPFFHIYGMTVLMNLVIGNGGCSVTMPRFDLELYLRLIAEHKARQLFLVPPVALALAKHPMVDDFDTSSVEFVVSGAAPMGPELTDACAKRLDAVVAQAYGMTELSPISHVSPESAPKLGSSGVTVPGCTCRIVDPETGGSLGPDEEGELWIKGPNVMKGYLNRPEATAESLTEDGWLKTGDLASIDAEGYMTIHDRVKELIKFKGFQVAPAELEAVLVSHPGVGDAAVVGLADEEVGEWPVAFLVKADAGLTDETVHGHMRENLSSYKQLKHIHWVDSIPKSASGKILRRELRELL